MLCAYGRLIDSGGQTSFTREEGKAVTLHLDASGTSRDPLHPGNVSRFQFGTREIPAHVLARMRIT
jgi:hypothetical protein